MNTLSLHIKKYRSVCDTTINLSGITVLAGINGTGKTTIARTLYDYGLSIQEFDENNKNHIYSKISRYMRYFFRVVDNYVETVEIVRFHLDSNMSSQEVYENCQSYFNMLLHLDLTNDEKSSFVDAILETVTFKLDVLPYVKDYAITGFEDLIEQSLFYIEKNLELLDFINRERNQDNLFSFKRLKNYKNSSDDIDLIQFKRSLIHNETGRIGNLIDIDHFIYVDTPMVVGLSNRRNLLHSELPEHWTEFNHMLLEESPNLDFERSDEYMKIAGVVEGEFKLSNMSRNLSYERFDGQSFEISEVATGLKSFAYMQRLLSNGYLTRNSIMIIDEPEAHLHPQWIVEFARLIVLLNKRIGVKFLLSSHSSDMVNAIRDIADHEEVSKGVHFYLAEEVDKYQYTFKDLGNDIDPIFDTYNIAFDKIEKYSTKTDE